MKGYKIHIKRIKKTFGEIIRTIKYPISNKFINNKETENQLFSSFINDDQKVRGISNIIDFYQNLNNYNLLDFWVDSLRAGIIFQPTSKTLINFVKKIKNEKTISEEIFDNSDNKIRKYFKKIDFIDNIILSDPKRSGSSKMGFYNNLFELTKDEYKNKKTKQILNNELKEIINFIVNSFYDNENNLLLETGEKQNKFWKENFNIDKKLLNKEEKLKIGEITNFILPELISIENKEITLEELINKRIQLAENYLLKINDNLNNKFKLTESILGLGNNFNSLSNYLNIFFDFLLNKKIDEIIKAYKNITLLNDLETEKIKKSLLFLSLKAKILEKPKFINQSWQEYRSVFGGKIQSWYSNYINRITKSKKNYQFFLENLENLISYLNKNIESGNEDKQERKKQEIFILNKIRNVKEILLKNEDIFENTKKFIIFSDYLAEIKIFINLYFQKYFKKEDNEKINQNKIFGFLFKNIEKPINFYGQSKKETLKKILEQTSLKIKDGFIIINKLLEEINNLKSDNFKKNTQEILDIFFDKLSKKTINSNFFVKKYQEILKKSIDINENFKKIFTHPEYYVFYKNSHEKQNKKIIKIKENLIIKELLNDFYLILKNINYNDLIKNPLTALEYLETAKSLISFFIENNINEEFFINKNDYKNFEKIIYFIETQKKEKYNKDEFNRIINQYFFSDLKGALNIYSKKINVNKYTLQIIKSQEKFPLILEFKNEKISYEDLINKNKEIINKTHKYFIVFDKNFSFKKIKNISEKTNHFFINKNQIIPIQIEKINENLIYHINSSYYQLQFLERLIYKPKNWKNINIEISEPSFILEIKNYINFDIFNNKINFKEKNKQFYISIPFKIKSLLNQKESIRIDNNQKSLYLGIDAGEYGVAYCLIDFSDDDYKIIEANYIKSKNIRKIKDYYHKIQERAKKGIFVSSTSVLQEIRENSINEIRNKIHNLYLKYNSSIIYEYSISNFETGSGKVTKIYDSIKKSDVIPDNEADKSIIKHVWGKEYIQIGKNLSAYASSYTCSSCGRSIYSILENFENDNIKIIKKIENNETKNILEIQTKIGVILGYSKDNKFKEGYEFKKTKESKNEFVKIIKNFARPPLEKSEVLLSFKKLNNKILKKIKKERGNSAIFVCPFKDCQKVFDADLQASFIMALRGFIKNKNITNKQINIFEETLKYLSQKKPIGLELLKNQNLFSVLHSKNQ